MISRTFAHETAAAELPKRELSWLLQQPQQGFAFMLELVFTVCSIVQGANCHELQPIRLDQNTMMIGCMMASQFEGAKWVQTHPNYYVIRATCQPAGKFAKL